MISGDDGIEVAMNMDYRYFFLSNKLYYDELSTMSLLYANSIYRAKDENSEHAGVQIKSGNNLTTGEDRTDKRYKKELIESMNIDKFNNLQAKEMMEHFGFKDVRTYYLGSLSEEASDGSDFGRDYKDTHKTKIAIGYRNLEYHGLYKTVIGIVIRGTAEDDDWDSDFDMGDVELRDSLKNITSGHSNHQTNYDNIKLQLEDGVLDKYDKQYAQELLHFAGGYSDWTHQYHHAGFDITANRVMEIVNDYYHEVYEHFDDDINVYDDGKDYNYVDGGVCFWVTGHSMGAGVANIVAANLVDRGYKDNVYCYTFASPNTYYLASNNKETYKEPHGTRYRCIFNIVNDDDFVPKLPMEECEWTRYGRTAKLSVNSIKNKIPSNFSPIYDPYGSYYKLWLKYSYKSNSFAVNNVIYMLNGVYDDNRHMRDETYSYDSKLTFSGGINYSQNELNKLNEEIRYIDIKKLDDFVFDYSRPYQKNEKDIIGYIQTQTPAYLMQSIAGAMHIMINDNGEIKKQGEDNTFLGSKVKDNQYRFIKTKMSHSGLGAKWSVLLSGGPLNALETPHYLESYYSLTKEINTTDFR